MRSCQQAYRCEIGSKSRGRKRPRRDVSKERGCSREKSENEFLANEGRKRSDERMHERGRGQVNYIGE
jgi:hypothetical protein